MIENKMYTKKIELPQYIRNRFNIPDDYEQYVHVNFVTVDFYFYLHDGSYADPYVYKNALTNPNIEREKQQEYTAVGWIMFTEYSKEFKEGDKYRKSHSEILPATWFTEAQEELANQDESLFDKDLEEMFGTPVEINTNINDNNDTEYYILPFSMNEDAYKKLYEACSNVIIKHPNWIEENKGYGYEYMPTEYKNSWLYIDNPSNDNVSNNTANATVNHEITHKYDGNDDTVNVKAILTIGFMSDKLVFNIRFIMVGGKQLTQPSDVSMVMPFVKPESSSEHDSDDVIMEALCEQTVTKLGSFIDMLMHTVNDM